MGKLLYVAHTPKLELYNNGIRQRQDEERDWRERTCALLRQYGEMESGMLADAIGASIKRYNGWLRRHPSYFVLRQQVVSGRRTIHATLVKALAKEQTC